MSMKKFYSILFASTLALSAFAAGRSAGSLDYSNQPSTATTEVKGNALTSTLEPEDLSIYPNPNNGEFTVQFTLKKAKTVSLEVYDILGNLLLKETVEGVGGTFQKTVDMRTAAPGYYLLMIRHGEDTVVKRITRQ